MMSPAYIANGSSVFSPAKSMEHLRKVESRWPRSDKRRKEHTYLISSRGCSRCNENIMFI